VVLKTEDNTNLYNILLAIANKLDEMNIQILSIDKKFEELAKKHKMHNTPASERVELWTERLRKK